MVVKMKENITERINKLEVILRKETEIYSKILDDEYKKMHAILDNRLQDLDLYFSYQTEKMEEGKKLYLMRKKEFDSLVSLLFPHMIGKASFNDVLKKLPLTMTVRIQALRMELKSVTFKLKNMNSLVPKLLKEGYEIFKETREILNKSKKIGYNNKGKEEVFKEKLSLLLNKQV